VDEMPSFSDRIRKGYMTSQEAEEIKQLIKGLFNDDDYYPISLLVCKREDRESTVLNLRREKCLSSR